MWEFSLILLLLAETSPVDPISGGAGWLGAGLLGLVLGWLLLKHLPDKDAQITALIERHLAVEERQRNAHAEWEIKQRAEFKETLNTMLEHSRMQIEGLGNALRQDLVALRRAIEENGVGK